MEPTNEQQHCLALTQNEPIVKVVAVAGSGKTSTLEYIAENIKRRSIYLAFNRVTADEASARFPSNVKCQTTHSLAYGVFGVQLQQKLSRPKGRYVNVAGTGSEIARYYGLDGVDGVATSNAVGLFVRMTVERYEQSADNNLTDWHLPRKDMDKMLKAEPAMAAYVLRYAKRLWKDRTDTDSNVLATHDTYLKLYQLSKPKLPYEIVYVDESQDSTPCVLDFVMKQRDTAKIVLVGDPRQAIYGWRGSVNAMEMTCCPEGTLSHSFRYGQGIADVATAVLHNAVKVTGRQDITCKVGYDVVDRSKKHMYLFRTNGLLLMEAVAAVDRGEKVKIEIDTKDFVKVLQSAVALYRSDAKGVKHERIVPYATWQDMVVESEEVGGEMKRLVNIVEGRMAEHIIDVLDNYVEPYEAVAVYTTAHKAKGREERQVILADDFPTNLKDGKWVGVSEAEENLLYVAVTRAKVVLEINTSVKEILEKYKMPYIGECPVDKAYEALVAREVRKMHREVMSMIE